MNFFQNPRSRTIRIGAGSLESNKVGELEIGYVDEHETNADK